MQRVGEPGVPELDVRQPRLLVEAEELVEVRAGEVRVDDDDPTSGPRERDGEVRDGRRFPLTVDGAGDHDHPGVGLRVREVQAPTEGAELLCLAARRIGEHDELVLLSKPRGGRCQPSEQAQAESLADGVDGLDSRVEGIRQEDDDEREDETEAECDQAVSDGAGADLRRVVGGLDHLRRRLLRRGRGGESFLPAQERIVVRRAGVTVRLELRELLPDLGEQSLGRFVVELALVLGERLRVFGRKLRRKGGIRVLDVKRQDVAAKRGRDRRGFQELLLVQTGLPERP